MFMVVESGSMLRDVPQLEVFGTYSAQTFEPPKEIIDIIKSKRPGWKWRNLS